MSNTDDKLKQAVLATAKEQDGKRRLACAQALKLAAQHAVTPAEIGRICDGNGIRIRACQLGCFN